MNILVADIGGTKAHFAVLDVTRGRVGVLVERRYTTRDHRSLEALASTFCGQVAAPVEMAAFAVAGPVSGDRAELTNVDWVIDSTSVARALGLRRVVLLNDFAAIGYGLPYLKPDELVTLQAGEPAPGGVRAVIGPGTGLGEGFIVRVAGRDVVCASEGAHAGFAPRNELEMALRRWLAIQSGDHVDYEQIVSGPGLRALYRFLTEVRGLPPSPGVLAAKPDEDLSAVITGEAEHCATCARTVDLFLSVFGAEAGNLALKVLATGGVYLGGGIAPRLIERLKTGPFLEAFRAKGRFGKLLSRVPVHVIVNSRIALLGAAAAVVAADEAG